MMARWGLEGMGSFTRERVARKELERRISEAPPLAATVDDGQKLPITEAAK